MSIEEKYDEIRHLITIGKEKGYLLYDEVNELLPADITSSEELDDLVQHVRERRASKSSIPKRATATTSCRAKAAKKATST